MQKRWIAILLIATLVFGTACSEIKVKAEKSTAYPVTIQFPATKNISKKETGSIECIWDENFFNQSASVFQPKLAKISMALSAAAYSASEEDGAKNIREALKIMGFDSIQSTHYEPTSNKEMETTAFTTAKKKITQSNGTDATIITVVIRGTEGKEWYENFNIADSVKEDQNALKQVKEHEGFRRAADEIMNLLEDYLTGIEGEKKIWIMGHSKGAAVANLLAADFIKKKGYDKEQVYAYTFAAPNVTTEPDTSLTNIYNFINEADFVAYCPLSQWGFSRNGITVSFQEAYQKGNQKLLEKDFKDSVSELTGGYLCSDSSEGVKEMKQFTAGVSQAVKNVQEYYTKQLGSKIVLRDFFQLVSDLLAGEPQAKMKAGSILLSMVTSSSELSTITQFLLQQNQSSQFLTAHMAEQYMGLLEALINEENFKPATTKSKTIYSGNSFTLAIDALPENASVTYRSSNTKIATVSKGKITGKNSGKAVITTTIKTEQQTFQLKTTVTVKEPVLKITSKKTAMYIGDTYTFQAKKYGTIAGAVKWSVSNSKIASVNSKTGKVKAKKAGTFSLYAKVGGKTAKVNIIVKAKNNQ